MAIRVYPQRIEFNCWALNASPTGLSVTLAGNANVYGCLTLADTRSSSHFQGCTYGYFTAGCRQTFPGYALDSTIDRFPFSSDSSATGIGNIITARTYASAQSSKIHGYVSGGWCPPASTRFSCIEKFNFSINIPTTAVGGLIANKAFVAGYSSTAAGYVAGGYLPAASSVIEKFPFATDSSSVQACNLVGAKGGHTGHSSFLHGYSAGAGTVIEKFSFATDTAGISVGSLATSTTEAAGLSSLGFGYVAGGRPFAGGNYCTITKWPFVADASSVNVSCLVTGRYGVSGSSGENYGYVAAGYPYSPSNLYFDNYEKFSFVTDVNASSVGSISGNKIATVGNQV